MKNEALIKKQLKSHPYKSPLLLRSSFLQIVAFFCTPYFKVSGIKSVRRIIPVADNSKLIADCWFQKEKEQCPTVIVLNGFEGYEKKDITRFGLGVSHKAFHYGYNVIILRQRGEGDGIHLTKSPGDFTAEDMPLALAEIRTWGRGNIYVIGLSLGGWTALLAAGKLQKANILAGIVGVSVPVNTMKTWSHIEKNKLFDAFLLMKYKSLIKRRMEIDPPGTWDEDELKAIRTKKQFFDTYKHTFGYPERFSNLDGFFAKVDITPLLATTQIPTLIINAQDDPAVPASPFIEPEISKNPALITLIPKHGSHGCFITGKKLYGDLDHHWAQNRAIEFINLLEQKKTIDDSLKDKV